MSLVIKKAERRQAKLKLALSGPSGGGKTMSALRLAKGIGGKIVVIDTENGSASLYGEKFDFDTIEIEPPFTWQKYVEAVEAAEKHVGSEGVIIVDSFSHAWAGEGGTLDQKAARDARGGNQFANWKEPKQGYAKIKNAILHSTAHIIVTIRAKQGYMPVEEGGKGKIQRVGMDPICEPNFEYEVSVWFDVAIDHKAQATKDRTSLFDNEIFQINEDTGAKLMAWLNSAKPAEPKHSAPTTTAAPIISGPRQVLLGRVAAARELYLKKVPGANTAEILKVRYGGIGTSAMTDAQLTDLAAYLESLATPDTEGQMDFDKEFDRGMNA